jgi:hypothetical protein
MAKTGALERTETVLTGAAMVHAALPQAQQRRIHVQHDQSEVQGSLRSKTKPAQVNEALCKILCHNLCCLSQSMYETEY